MSMFRKIFDYFFYDPVKVAKKCPNVSISDNTVLLKTCRFRFEDSKKNNSVVIGSNSMVGATLVFESSQGEVKIGNNTFINGGTNLISRTSITIGSHVTIAWGCTIYDHNSHSLDFIERQKDIDRQLEDYKNGRSFIFSKDWEVVNSRPIVINDNAWIGFDSVILSGVTIGEGAIIGARSVIRHDVEPWTVVSGNPAVIVKRLK